MKNIHINKAERKEWRQPQIVQFSIKNTKNGATSNTNENNLYTNKVS